MFDCILLTLCVLRRAFLRFSERGPHLYIFEPGLESDHNDARRRAEC